jgi:hypothetical protein
MPTSFLGLFVVSAALALPATLIAFSVQLLVRRLKRPKLR